jgi:Undecaprenyl-phosphate glucose phosphotransferase
MSEIRLLGGDPPKAARSSTESVLKADNCQPRVLTGWRLRLLAPAFDLIAIISVSMLAYSVNGATEGQIPSRYLLSALMVATSCFLSFFQARLYETELLADYTRALQPLFLRWTLVFLSLAALTALVHEPQLYSRLWFIKFYAGGILAIGLERWAMQRLIRGWIARGYCTRTVAIIGHNPLAEQLIAKLEGNRLGIRIIGIFDDRDPAFGQTAGTIDDLLNYSRNSTVDIVVIALPISPAERIQSVIHRLRHQPLNIRVLPGPIGLDKYSRINLPRTELPGVQLIAVANPPISEVALFMKRGFDQIGSALALLILSPVFILCAAGVALSNPGPVLFRQQRIGYQGRAFTILKFRTMYADRRPHNAPAERNDPRVFSFGRLLRRWSLDELPQLFNVLKGEMSLVGPRPHVAGQEVKGHGFFEDVNEYAGRHRVKPGITGWAQVNGWRGPAETLEQIERRVEHDIFYIENWSLLLDVVILVKTVFVVFFGKNSF